MADEIRDVNVVKRTPSIEESLLKLADKVDPDNKVEVSPNNLNPNYSIQHSLERIADSDLSGGGSGGAGYTVETKAVAVAPEQTVETQMGNTVASAQINLAEGIAYNDIPDTLTITFQGQEYVCEANTAEGVKFYGGATETDMDFSQYPFGLSIGEIFGGLSGIIYTESAGTYTIKATGENKTVTPSEEFKQAVESLTSSVLDVPFTTSGSSMTLQSSWSEISTALQNSGARIYSSVLDMNIMTGHANITAYPIVSAGFTTVRSARTYTVDALMRRNGSVVVVTFTTTKGDGTGLTATLS